MLVEIENDCIFELLYAKNAYDEAAQELELADEAWCDAVVEQLTSPDMVVPAAVSSRRSEAQKARDTAALVLFIAGCAMAESMRAAVR